MRVALYPRVSSIESAENGYSIADQTERLKKYCEVMNWDVYKIYTDPGYSGATMERPGLKEMIKDVEAGLIDKVVVYKLDRLSRSQKDTLYLIEDVFLKNKTDFVSITESFDTSSSFGIAMVGILAVFAQLERSKIQERTTAGKEGRAKEGLFHGSKFIPIGYDYVDGFLEFNEYERMQILELYDLFFKGTPLRTIETIFREKGYKHKHGYWTPTTMRRVMSSKTILGYTKHRDKWYEGQHDPIIDETTWLKGVKLLKERADAFKEKGIRPGAQTTYLGGLLYCKHCGAKYHKNMGGSKKYGRLFYYCCHSRSKKVKAMIKDPTCKNAYHRIEKLDNFIFDEIRKLETDPEYYHQIRKEKIEKSDIAEKVNVLEKEIAKLDDQISRFMDLYGIGKFTVDQVSSKIDPLNEERTKLARELEEITSLGDEMDEVDVREIVESFGDILDRGDFHEIRLTIESLINFIEVDNDIIEIHWKFA
jgi:site-specific DNA recombinase